MIKPIAVSSLVFLLFVSQAEAKSLKCTCDRLAKSWVIEQGRIVMHSEGHTQGVRQIASELNEIRSFRTQLTSQGVSRIINHNGLKYSIHVNNLNSPSELDDYVAIKNGEGHEVVYPLNCK
jgi:hypothetical protein